MKISGFSLVRNAIHLEYPFPEYILSVLPLCDEFILNVGDSEDSTLEKAMELQEQFPEKVRILQSKWETKSQEGGFQLREQTDAALRECTGDWCFYIQADEAIHEADFPKIRQALERANRDSKVDAVLFDWLHFYGNYAYTIEGRNWYRKEVRLFKNRRGIQAFRDAQGFRRNGQRLVAVESGARVFHYGYVRSVESLKKKAIEMARWWGATPEIQLDQLKPRRHVGLRRFKTTHPLVMQSRIASASEFYDPSQCKRIWDKNEIKNAVTFIWERFFPRIGEFRNYTLSRHPS